MRRRTNPSRKRPDHRGAASNERPEPRAFLRRADFAGGPLSGPDEITVRDLIDLHNDVARAGETMERVLAGQAWVGADQLRASRAMNAEFRRVVLEILREITSHEVD